MIMKWTRTLLSVMFSLTAVSGAQTTAIIGGTLIDLTRFGHSTSDLADSVIVIQGEEIVAVGRSGTILVPKDARILDARGKFVIPGLIDGFGALRTQGFANAYLYEGVTTVYVPSVPRAGNGDGEVEILKTGKPSPR